MATSYIHRQKIRSWQLFLLTIGGVLMFWGYLLFSGAKDVNNGFAALRQERFDDAYKHFTSDISSNEERLESYAGLGVAQLALNKGLEAETTYEFIHEVLDEDRTPAPRMRIWKDRNTRDWGRYKGYFFYFESWIHAERVLRAYRRKEDPRYIDDLKSDYERALEPFEAFVTEVESSRNKAGYWADALNNVKDFLNKGDKTDSATRARKALKDVHDLTQNTSEELENAFEPLKLAIAESPDNIEVMGWYHALLAELAGREGVKLRDGSAAIQHLHAMADRAWLLEDKRWKKADKDKRHEYGLMNVTRFLLGMARASQLLARYDMTNSRKFQNKTLTLIERSQLLLQEIQTNKGTVSDEAYEAAIQSLERILAELPE